MAEGHSPLDHVRDSDFLDLPLLGHLHLPQIAGFQLSRFMVMELVAALLVAAVAIPLSRHAARNRVTRGPLMNTFEAMLLFIRDEVARPAIGGGGGGPFFSFPWAGFFFFLLSPF